MRISVWRRYLRFWRPDVDADVDDELRFHLEERIADLMARGYGREAAQAEAVTEFGDLTEVRDTLRAIDARVVRRRSRADWWEATWQDLRHAYRSLMSTRGVAFTIVLTLALGIGANAAMFTFLDTLFLRAPDGIERPNELRRIWAHHFRTFDNVPFAATSFSYPDYLAMSQAMGGMMSIAAYTTDEDARLGPSDEFPRATVGYATANLLPLLGARLAAGRFFVADEDRMGEGAPVAVLSHSLWERRFASDPAILGQQLTVGRQRYTIVGITRSDFSGIDLDAVDVWIPLASMPAQWYNNEWYRTRNFQGLWLVARLPAAANDRAVEAGLTQLLRLPPVEGPPADSLETAELGSIILARGPWTADHDTAIALRLSGVAVIVLLIACANVTNLLLARATRRRREVAVRLALGMSRARLAAMLITEAALLALVAGAVASLAALWGGLLLRALLMPNTHFAAPVFDWRVGVATAAAALIAGIGTGALPARQAGQGDLTLALKAGARSGVLQRSRVRPALLMAQAALSVVLLLAAGALLRSMHNVETLRLGFDVDHIVFAELHEKRPEVLRGVVPDVAQRLTTIDNVESVASASMAPMRGFAATMIFLPGRDSLIFGVQPVFNAVSPEFFATTGMRLLRGRGFEKGAGRSGAAEVVISQELAHTLWPGLDPIGRCMQFGARTNPCYTVVGVVENARHWDLTEEPWPEYYLPINRMPVDGYKPSVLIIRTSPNHAASVAAEARRLLHTAFPDNAPTVTAMKEILAPQFHPWRLGATLFSAFGILALCIAAIGVYSTLSYTISQRNHEIGVRVALGAQPRDVARLVFSNALTIVTVGIALGIVLALGLERLIAALLYGTSAHDPLTIGAMAAVLIGAATVAAALPARRASRVDPVIALRTDG